MALLTIPLFITTVLVIKHVRRRNLERERLGVNEKLDSRVVSATIVLSSLTPETRERTLEALPQEMARAIVMILPELPPVTKSMVEKEKLRWLAHFSPPRQNFDGLELVDSAQLGAATVKLVLEDSN